ncbi:MAG: PBP1A family penicillin-binding protein [Synergistaceae bacterium]|nr:PBP1A family penicillin-binding protein [Synergistaceae bacterium]
MFFMVLLLLAIGLGSAGVTYYIVKISGDLPTKDDIIHKTVSEPSIVYDRNGEVVARLFIENRTTLQLNQISPWMVRAVLAAEDSAFYQHVGFRVSSIVRAAIDTLTSDRMQGGSTITQQLARNLFLTQDRTIARKVKEIIIAMRMEKLLTKDEILAKYLNTINFGRGAWGVETASRTYFGCPALELNVAQASILAGLIAAPGRYNPLSNFQNAKNRQNYVLGRMETLGWLNQEERRRAYGEELVFRHVPNTIEEYNRAPYFVSHILFNDLLPRYGADRVYTGGLRIHTTLDLKLQEAGQEAIRSLKSQGALVCIEAETGEVLALVGGKDFQESKFNRATQAFRQPGSSFKPIVYAAALENDIMPTDHFMDTAVTFKNRGGHGRDWSPQNSNRQFHGEVTIQRALASSYNIVAVKTAAYMGTQPIVNMARVAGITSEHLPSDLSMALGSASVTPLEMAVVFNCFTNGGKRTPPIMIREIRTHDDGSVLLSNESRPVQAIKPETAYALRSMMIDTIRGGTGGRARLENNVEAFGKTGTSNDFIDGWFIGGAPGLTTALYVGNDDHTSLRNVYGRSPSPTGGIVAAPPWKTFMDFAVAYMGTPAKFDPPPAWVEVDSVSICRATGFRARSGCQAVPLYMPSGKAPSAQCPTHGGNYNDAVSDPNAPRLFLIEQDDDYYEPAVPVAEPRETPIQQPPVQIPDYEPYRHQTPADVFEDRYRQLLREYGIN